MIGGDEPLLTPEILQNFMEQALTVITPQKNMYNVHFSSMPWQISRTMPRQPIHPT